MSRFIIANKARHCDENLHPEAVQSVQQVHGPGSNSWRKQVCLCVCVFVSQNYVERWLKKKSILNVMSLH
jgi:hypothetical protein